MVKRHPNTKHGYFGTPTYNSWAAMRQRCEYPSHIEYKRYGARGIKVCERWHKFENFLADMGERPEGTTIDRKESDGDYTPDNCRWATKLVQANNSRSNHYLEFNGKIQTLSDWAREYGHLNGQVIAKRLRRGWSVEMAITAPAGHKEQEPGGKKTQFKAKIIEFDGLAMSQQDWAKRLGLANSSVLARRLKAGWPLERALRSGPVGYPRNPKESTG